MKKRYNNITNIRCFAILLVVLGHATAIYEGNWGGKIQLDNIALAYVCRVIKSFHMPLFMSISGYLFYRQADVLLYATERKPKLYYSQAASFIKKKAFRLIVPLILVKYFWVQPIRYMSGYYDINANAVDNIKNYILNFDVGHLWFLYVLFAIFCLQYFMYPIYANNDKIFSMILLASVIIGYLASIMSLPAPVSNIIKYNCWFMFGEYIFFKQNQEKIIKHDMGVLIASGVITTILTIFLVMEGRFLKCREIKILVEFIVAGLDIILIHYFSWKYLKNCVAKWVEKIADWSMGIYLFHEPILYLVLSKYYGINSYLLTCIMFIVGMLISVIITLLLRKTKMGIVLGEKMR